MVSLSFLQRCAADSGFGAGGLEKVVRLGELVGVAWEVVAPLLALAPNELEFVKRLQIGELKPELLYPEKPAMAHLVSAHPATLWRLQNIRRNHP